MRSLSTLALALFILSSGPTFSPAQISLNPRLIGDPLPPQHVYVETPASLDLDDYIEDPLGGPLSYQICWDGPLGNKLCSDTNYNGFQIHVVLVGSIAQSFVAPTATVGARQDMYIRARTLGNYQAYFDFRAFVRNTVPRVKTPIPDAVLYPALDERLGISLDTYFEDPDPNQSPFFRDVVIERSPFDGVQHIQYQNIFLSQDYLSFWADDNFLARNPPLFNYPFEICVWVDDGYEIPVSNPSKGEVSEKQLVNDCFDLRLGNSLPSGNMPNVSFTSFQSDQVFALNSIYSDAEGNAITYKLGSYDSQLVNVVIEHGSSLRVTSKGLGQTVVPIEACNTYLDYGRYPIIGNRTECFEDSFTITIENHPPQPVGVSFLVELEVGETKNLRGSAMFRDAERDPMSFGIQIDDPSIVGSSVNGDIIQVTGLLPGRTDAIISARDPYHPDATKYFGVITVINDPPDVLVDPLEFVLEVGESVSLNKNNLFSDPDQDPLSLSAHANIAEIVDLSIAGDVLTITGSSPGTTLVTIQAADPYHPAVSIPAQVTVVNFPPRKLVQSLDLVLEVGETAQLDKNNLFSDSDGDPITFSASPRTDGIVDLSIDGNILSITGAFPGQTTVDIHGADPYFPAATIPALVTVVNDPPERLIESLAYTLRVGESVSVDKGTIFTDSDGDPLTFSAQSDNPGIAGVSAAGNQFTFTGVSPGNATIILSATDPYSQEATVPVQVTVVNDAPVTLTETYDVFLEIDESESVNAGAFFFDADGDPLSFAASPSNGAIVEVSVLGDTVTLTGKNAGSTIVEVQALDPFHPPATMLIAVTVNGKPIVTPPTEEIVLNKGETTVVDLLNFVFDPENDFLQFEVVTYDSHILQAELNQNVLTLTGLNAGSTDLILTISDSVTGKDDAPKASVDLVLPIQVVANAPFVTDPIADREIRPNETFSVDLTTVFEDPDGDSLTFGAFSSDSGIANAVIDGDFLVITGILPGIAQMEISATDPSLETAILFFTVWVNHPPNIVSGLSDQSLFRNEERKLDISSVFGDTENDPIQLSAETDNPSVLGLALNGNKLTLTGISLGTSMVTLVASDTPPGNKSDEAKGMSDYSFQVTVVNHEPTVLSHPADIRLEEGESQAFDIEPYFEDLDDEPLQYSVFTAHPERVSVDFSGSDVHVMGLQPGNSLVTVTATDPNDDAASLQFTVLVNTPPIISESIDEITLFRYTPTSIDLNTYVTDPDGDNLTFSANSLNPDVVSAELSGSTLILMGKQVAAGNISVHVSDESPLESNLTNKDGASKASSSFLIPVFVDNISPQVVSTPDNLTIELGEIIVLDISKYFDDPDGDKMRCVGVPDNAEIVSVAQNANGIELLVHGLKSGSAYVLLTATDSYGGTATTGFVIQVNSPPSLIATIPPISVDRANYTTIELTNHFADLDNDPLEYHIAIEDESVVTFEMNQTTLRLIGRKVGSTNVELTVSDRPLNADKDQRTKSHTKTSFTVTVVNLPPVSIATMNDIFLVQGGLEELNLFQFFDDQDGRLLTFSATSSRPENVSTTLATGKLTLSGLSGGTSRVRVTAIDPDQAQASQSFNVLVNNAPEISGTLPIVELFVPGNDDKFSFNLEGGSPLFADPNGDRLDYRATVAPATIASVSLDGTTLQVVGQNPGNATLTIAAEDPYGASIEFEHPILVLRDHPPTIALLRTTENAQLNEDFIVTADASDDRGISSGTLFFRAGNQNEFQSTPMEVSGATSSNTELVATIPGLFVSPAGLEFKILISDGVNPPVESSLEGILVAIPDGSIRVPANRFNTGSTENDYRLVSVPGILEQPDASSIFEPSLGSYNRSSWRFLRMESDALTNPYVDLDEGPVSIQAGMGYWILSRDIPEILPILGRSVTLPTTDAFEVDLPPGFSIVGNPYHFALPSSHLTLEGDQEVDFFGYNGSFHVQDSIEPFEGYFVANNSESTRKLRIAPHGSDTSKNGVEKNSLFEWKIGVEARSQGKRFTDLSNYIAVSESALDDLDNLDLPEPPPFGRFVSVSFPHDDWLAPLKTYRADVRNAGNEGAVWIMRVATDLDQSVELTFTGIQNIPEDLVVTLLDPATQVQYNLRDENTVTINTSLQGRDLKLVAGTKSYVQKVIPQNFPQITELLTPFPNPSSGIVTVPFHLENSGIVDIRVFNTLGQEIDVIMEREFTDPGRHAVVWSNGRSISNGAYFVRMIIDGTVKTQPFIVSN